MTMRTVLRPLVVALVAVPCLYFAGTARADKNLNEFAQSSLKDIAAEVKVLWKNDHELSKIGKGYAEAYSLSEQAIWCKEPDRVRVQGKKGILTIRFVTDGLRRMTEVSNLHIHHVENIKQEPSKANNISDLGVITPEWIHHVHAQWAGSESRNGISVEMFHFDYPQDPDVHHTIALDPATRTIVEHVTHFRHGGEGPYKRKIVYSDIKQFTGVSVPTTATVFNGEGKAAAQMRYDRIRVNSGLQDTLFKF